MDIARKSLERIDRDGRDLIEADLTRPIPEDVEPYDAVLALDVIEHLDDDRGAVRRLGQLVRPGGLAIVSVPALPDLFTEFDEVQGHRRRYLPETLRLAFSESDLQVERILWWGSWMVPLLRRQRGQSLVSAGLSPAETYRRYLALPPWPGPLALRIAFALDQGRTIRGRPRIGTSLIAVARRRC